MTTRTGIADGSGPDSIQLTSFSSLQIGDRVRRPAWGTGVIEEFEVDAEQGVLVVVRHPRTMWRCKPGELVFLRRENSESLTHSINVRSKEMPDGVEAHPQASSSDNVLSSPDSGIRRQVIDAMIQQDIPSTAIVPYSASEK